MLAILLLLLPAVIAVGVANGVAGVLEPLDPSRIGPSNHGSCLRPHRCCEEILIGRYGLGTMGPLLLVWAVPTVILYALFLGAYKASGLVERITVALHPLLRPFGLSGRDLVRVIMGFGCNVPAVIQHSSLFQLFPADLCECDRFWLCLFLPVWGHTGGLQRCQFARFGCALPGLLNPDHPDLHSSGCA